MSSVATTPSAAAAAALLAKEQEIKNSFHRKSNLRRREAGNHPGLNVTFLFKGGATLRAHKLILFNSPITSEFLTRELAKTWEHQSIDLSSVDTTPEAVDQVLSCIYGLELEELEITSQNIRPFLNAMAYFQMEQLLEGFLKPGKLFGMSAFWDLDNDYIYNLCRPYMSLQTMKNGFLDWILENPPSRRQYRDKFCGFKRVRAQSQRAQSLFDLLDQRKKTIGELKAKIQNLEQTLELKVKDKVAQIAALHAKLKELELKSTHGKIDSLEVKFKAWIWILAAQLSGIIGEKNQLMESVEAEKAEIRLDLEKTTQKLQESQQVISTLEAKLKDQLSVNAKKARLEYIICSIKLKEEEKRIPKLGNQLNEVEEKQAQKIEKKVPPVLVKIPKSSIEIIATSTKRSPPNVETPAPVKKARTETSIIQ